MTQKTSVDAIGFSPDGKYLATGSEGTAWVSEVPSGQEVARMSHAGLRTIVFSPNGKYLATASSTDSTVRVWEVSSGREMARMTHEKSARFSSFHPVVAFSPDGKYLATGSTDGIAALWRLWPEDLIAEACVRLTHNLTPEEWHQYVGDEPYHKTCANLP
jgi:WD40 repeat protein